MECGQCFPSRPFVVLPVDRFIGYGGSPLERQKQDSRVYRKTGTMPLILTCDGCEDEYNKQLCESVGL